MPRTGAAALWATLAISSLLALAAVVAVALRSTGFADAAAATQPVVPVTAATVELSEFAIDPATVTVPAGTPVQLSVVNAGSVAHDLTVEGGPATPQIPGDGSATLRTGPTEAGRYRLFCSVPGHAEAGMEATLAVGEGITADGTDRVDDRGGHEVMTPKDMVDGHMQGIAAFPADSAGKGNQPLRPTVTRDGTKVFELTAEDVQWEVEPGAVRQAMAFNGQVPGPRIDVDRGDRVRLVVHNELDVPTGLHPHGMIVPFEQDGVPGLTQDPIMPGESFTYEFTARNAGSHMYHSHFDSAVQVPMGLLGTLVVHDQHDPHVDLDYTMVLNDGPLGFTINGKGFPATEPLVVHKGQSVRVRYFNEGLQIHPMHLHGMPQKVIAKDGWDLPQPYMADTVMVAPGERVDVLIEAIEPGVWAYHCHILNHAEAADGMFGMVTALVVE